MLIVNQQEPIEINTNDSLLEDFKTTLDQFYSTVHNKNLINSIFNTNNIDQRRNLGENELLKQEQIDKNFKHLDQIKKKYSDIKLLYEEDQKTISHLNRINNELKLKNEISEDKTKKGNSKFQR